MDLISAVYHLPKFDVCVNKQVFTQLLLYHPGYGTIFSFIDTLNKFGVNNYIVNINTSQLIENPFPVIGIIKSDNNDASLAIMLSIKKGKVYYIENRKVVFSTINEFEKKWTGDAIYVVANKSRLYFRQVIAEKMFVYFILATFLFYFLNNSAFPDNLLYCLNIVGFLIVFLLFKHSIGISNRFTSALCKTKGIIDCEKVLNSKASSVFGFKMSYVGGAFFLFQFFLIVFGSFTSNNNIITIACFIAILSIPYILFSLFYQFFVVKKLCMLCIMVVSILIGLSVVAILSINFRNIIFNIEDILVVVLFLLLTLVVFKFIYKYYNHIKKIENYMFVTYALKNDYNLFKKMLSDSREAKVTNLIPVIIGDVTSLNSITVVISFYCTPCYLIFKEITDLLKKNEGLFNASIYFTGISGDLNNFSMKILLYMFRCYTLHGSVAFIDCMLKWYEHGHNSNSKIKEEIERLRIEDSDIEIVSNYINSVIALDIKYTPTIIVQDRIVPQIYTLSDLIYFMKCRKYDKSI